MGWAEKDGKYAYSVVMWSGALHVNDEFFRGLQSVEFLAASLVLALWGFSAVVDAQPWWHERHDRRRANPTTEKMGDSVQKPHPEGIAESARRQ